MALLIIFSVATVATAQETRAQEAVRLQEEAQQLFNSGRYKDGIDKAKRALRLREQVLGAEHPDVAASLHVLGSLYRGAGDYSLSRSTLGRALALREKALGPEHTDTVKSLVSLARAYSVDGDYSQAEPLYQRALATLEKVLGPNHLEITRPLSGLAYVYARTAAYDRAVPLYERLVAILEHSSGGETLDLAAGLGNFGSLYRSMGAYNKAKELIRRAQTITEKLGGPEHRFVAVLLELLAAVHLSTGDYVEAEALFKRALEVNQAKLGPGHPLAVQSLSNLASLYAETGAYDQAEPMLRRAIEVLERTPDSGKEVLTLSLRNLADLYSDLGRYSEAESLCRRALEISRKYLKRDHPYTAEISGTLGNVYRLMGTYDKARPMLERSVATFEATRGKEHSDTAYGLYRLGVLHSEGGAYLDAKQVYQRALDIYEKVVGPEHRDVALVLRSLAVAHWARGETKQALSLLQRVQGIETRNSERFLSAGSESRKRDYLQTLTEGTFQDVSFAMSTSGTAATVLGLTSVLRHKGRVLDAVSDNLTRIRRSVAPADQALLEQLADVASQLSALTYGQGGNLSPDQYRVRLVQLSTRQEQLQADLASRSRAFSREVLPVTVANVSGAIPANAVLVEWFRYTRYDSKKSLKARSGPPRYVAYVLKRDAEPVAVDIGAAQPIEALARRLRNALANSASGDVRQHAAALSDKLLAPLRVHLRGVEHILLSPDGELNLVPMAALLDESGAYLAERFDVSYLTSGRDLLRIAGEPSGLTNAVVMADPDYGKRGAASLQEPFTLRPTRSLDLDRGGLEFRSLPGTALEAQDLKRLLKLDDDEVLLRADASETRLKRLRAPRILHIASHGFFLSDQQLTDEMSKRRSPRAAPLTPSENPLLRSGIALAGANERNSGDDDGILTALEATQLDLSGTELVVLSACDSGVGEVENGEGVYGLRRALALAGAQTQVTSLWKVSDDVTRKLMVDYYRRLQQGEGRAAALLRTQRAILADPALSHPYYWASFIPIGNWNPLPMGK
jgi:CHAT domain-containing protein/tetratricopeptide (TPR) repeat protein